LNTRYDSDLHEPEEQDREISLGTTTILGIFFVLALLCAVFFGFGYSIGRRSALPVAGTPATTNGSESNASKPSPGSRIVQTAATSPVEKPLDETQSTVVPLDSANPAPQESQPIPHPVSVKAVTAVARPEMPTEPVPKPTLKPAAMVPIAAVTTFSPGTLVVQVAAMSHQEDADVVAVDLKRRGYPVAIRRESQDKLFHVQIGPLSNKKEADAMRQRLQTDGYNNAIVK